MSFQGKQLFPSAGHQQTQPDQNSAELHLATSSTSASDQALDWLKNESFNTQDAIAIAKFHASKETTESRETEERAGQKKRPHGHTIKETTPKEVKKAKDSHGYKDRNRSKQHRRHHKQKSHKHSSKYSSDSAEDRKKHSRHSKKKKKHKKHEKHESRSSRSRDERMSSSSSSEDEDYQRISSQVDDNAEQRIAPVKATWLDELGRGATEIFYLDNKADKNNLCFDSLHFTNTAFYKRFGRSCLGLDTEMQKISWRKDKEKLSKKSSRADSDRYFGKGRLTMNEEASEVILPARSDNVKQSNETKPVQSFISLASDSTKPSPSEFDPLGVYDVSTRQYLGDQPPMPSATDQYENTQNLPQGEERYVQSKQVAEFNKHLHDNPHDIHKWLEFVKFQDTTEAMYALTGGNTEIERRKKKTMLIVEKKCAILEKALKHNPGNIELQLAQLELCRESWSETQQIKEWEKVLRSHADNTALWHEYILFNQSSFSIFSVSKAVALYEKCFEALQSADHNQEDGEDSGLINELMDLLVQQCQFWRQSGHTEKAIAAFQAMVELNCFCPDNLGESTLLKGQVAFLETFWDSDEPRFGEKDAKGWKTWMTKKEKGGWEEIPPQSTANSEEEEDSKPLDNTKPVWQAWLQEEVHREQNHLLPWRPDTSKGETEDDCEDPDRLILFDDISGVLFKVQSQQDKYNIIRRFLQFLGVVTTSTASSTSSTVQKHFHLSLEHPRQLALDVGMSCVHKSIDVDSGTGWHQCCNGIASNCGPLDSGAETKSKDLQDLITNVFTQSLELFEEPARTSLLVLWLRHELSSVCLQGTTKQQKKQAKAARKFAKKLLSEEKNRNNLLLWEVFATWEWSLGNIEDACRMLDMALSFAKQLKDNDHKRTVAQVVSSYTGLICNRHTGGDIAQSHQNSASTTANGSTEESLYILTNFVDGSKYVPYKTLSNQTIPSVAIIRARKLYQEMFEAAVKEYKEKAATQEWIESSGSYVVHLARCYARFQYLTVGIQAANVVMEETLSSLKPTTDSTSHSTHHIQQNLDYELVMSSYAKLVSQHVLHNPTPLSILRNLLRRALTEFPDNPAFMQLFISTEAKSHIAGRVRRYFDRATQDAKTPVPWLCAISAEKQRQQMVTGKLDAPSESTSLPETGISNRMRSLFDRAMSHKASRHCVLLWRLFIQFEVHQGKSKRAQAIFYQALQHCPWAKVLYVDAVRYFPDKLQDVHDLLMEKELRIRAPLEEVELLMQG